MKFSVQSEDLDTLKEALESSCDKVRFGAEFCEWKIPDSSLLREAYALSKDLGKDFAYVTPRISESNLDRIRDQLDLLNKEGTIEIVCNDFGAFNMLGHYPNLSPHLGRQLVHVPSRCPWMKTDIKDILFSPKMTLRRARILRGEREVYSQTSLHYLPTIQFYRDHGVQGIDLDWIPRCFPDFDFLEKQGLELSVHLQLVPVTLTRKCHTARFLGERAPQACSKPCKTKAFLLKHDELELFLNGNVVFSQTDPSEKDMKSLLKHNVAELVISMNPVTGMSSRERIDEFILQLKSMGDFR